MRFHYIIFACSTLSVLTGSLIMEAVCISFPMIRELPSEAVMVDEEWLSYTVTAEGSVQATELPRSFISTHNLDLEPNRAAAGNADHNTHSQQVLWTQTIEGLTDVSF